MAKATIEETISYALYISNLLNLDHGQRLVMAKHIKDEFGIPALFPELEEKDKEEAVEKLSVDEYVALVEKALIAGGVKEVR